MIIVVALLVFGIIIALAFVTVSRPGGRAQMSTGSLESARVDDWSGPARRTLGDGNRLVAQLSTATACGAGGGMSEEALHGAISSLDSLSSTLSSLIAESPSTSDALVVTDLAVCAQRLTDALEHEVRLRRAELPAERARPSDASLEELLAAFADSLEELEVRLDRS